MSLRPQKLHEIELKALKVKVEKKEKKTKKILISCHIVKILYIFQQLLIRNSSNNIIINH